MIKGIVFFLFFGVFFLFFLLKKKYQNRTCLPSKHLNSRRPQQTMFNQSASHNEKSFFPIWLTNEITNYQRDLLSYALYELTLEEKYTKIAKSELEKIGKTVYAPPPLLLNDARNKNNCSCRQMEMYLQEYLNAQTGLIVQHIDPQKDLEDFLVLKAKEEALKICDTQIARHS